MKKSARANQAAVVTAAIGLIAASPANSVISLLIEIAIFGGSPLVVYAARQEYAPTTAVSSDRRLLMRNLFYGAVGIALLGVAYADVRRFVTALAVKEGSRAIQEITPVSDFYVVSKNLVGDPVVDSGSWRLNLPTRSITYADVAAVLGLSDSPFFARIVTLIGAGDHAGILDALQEAAESGRDFKMLYRDLLNFVRNLLLVAAGADRLVSASPEELSVAGKFSYSELLRIANLLVRDDDTVNHAEHQRLAVEVSLLKAATFPRLRAAEEVLSGREVSESRSRVVENSRETPKPRDSDTALFIPPATSRVMLRSAAAWERIGKRWFPTFAGVLLVEATKQIYAKPAAARAPRRRLVYAPAPHGL